LGQMYGVLRVDRGGSPISASSYPASYTELTPIGHWCVCHTLGYILSIAPGVLYLFYAKRIKSPFLSSPPIHPLHPASVHGDRGGWDSGMLVWKRISCYDPTFCSPREPRSGDFVVASRWDAAFPPPPPPLLGRVHVCHHAICFPKHSVHLLIFFEIVRRASIPRLGLSVLSCVLYVCVTVEVGMAEIPVSTRISRCD
jgi:hypothetical protein